MANPLSDEKLEQLECHFNWDIVSKQKTKAFYNDRIELVKFDLSDESKKNIPQRYCLLGYLQSKAYYDLDGEDNGLLAFQKALESLGDTTDHLGYRAVVLGNLIYHYSKRSKDYEQAKKYYTDYSEMKECSEYSLNEHPEVLAMKAFSLSYVWKHEEAIKIYNEALKDPKYRNIPEWVLGLAYAKDFHLAGRDTFKTNNDEIQILLRRVIELDPNYHYAILKLAKHLKKTQGSKHVEEIKYLIDMVLNHHTVTLNVKEEAAVLLNQLQEYEEEGVRLLKSLEEENPDVVKIKRSLARYHFELGKKCLKKDKPKSKESFETSVEYYDKISNKRHFDKTYLASTYQYLKTLDEESSGSYQEKIEKIYKELLRHGDKELPKAQIQIYYYYALYKNSLKDYQEACKYFKESVAKAAECSKEEVFGNVKIVKYAEDRLLNFATSSNYDFLTKIDALELKGWIQLKRKNYDSAIFYQERAIQECTESKERCMELQDSLAGYFLERSKNRMGIAVLDHISYDDMFADTVKKINELPDSSQEKWKLLCEANHVLIDKMMAGKILIKLNDFMKKFETQEKLRRQNSDHHNENIVIDVICECKSLLDSHLNDLKIKFGKDPLDPNEKKMYFTSFQEGVATKNMAKKLKERFETKLGLKNFSKHFADLFNFFVENLHPSNVPWLNDLIIVRNVNEHCRTEVKQVLNEKFPNIEDQVNVVRKASKFTAKVWILAGKGGENLVID